MFHNSVGVARPVGYGTNFSFPNETPLRGGAEHSQQRTREPFVGLVLKGRHVTQHIVAKRGVVRSGARGGTHCGSLPVGNSLMYAGFV